MSLTAYIEQQFVLGASASSAVIAYASGGPRGRTFSHTDAVLPEGLAGARMDQVGGCRSGFYVRPTDYGAVTPTRKGQERWRRRLVMRLYCTPTQRTEWIDFHRAQLGKPYDWRAIVDFGIQRNWREDDAWFCSEEGTTAIERTIRGSEFYLPAAKVGPTMLVALMSAMGAIATMYESTRQTTQAASL